MNYLKSIILLIIVSFFGSILQHTIAHTNLAMLYILVVVITSILWGKGPSLVAAILSVLIFDFFFVPPHFSLTVADTEYLITFGTLFIVGTVISSLTLKARKQAETAKNREAHTRALYNMSKDIVQTIGQETLFKMVINHVNKTFDAETAIFVNNNDKMIVKSGPHDIMNTETDASALMESFKNGKPAGWNTNLVPEANVYYLPIHTTNNMFGVLGVKFNKKKSPTHEQYRLLETFANQIALAFERNKLADAEQQANSLREREKLHTVFLNSISHDMKTPLAAISGSLSSILNDTNMDETSKKILLETAYEESTRMNHLVGDLLDMARVEAGALQINKNYAEVKDLIGSSLKQMEKTLKDFTIFVKIPYDLPEISVDFILMTKVLKNILDNAVKHSQNIKEIIVSAYLTGNCIDISIADRGIGIPTDDLEHVFNKFYRVKRPTNYDGTGLGLSVCKGIVEAHKGKIRAENFDNGGTIIIISMPL
ncbi:MAG: Sensor protein KdpD [Elusimicrobia bacterium ADurb.Bin231]|nr:MAG: Sensor protein KdpD [Elusimicrobia bacterium ADurb.Bin231]